MAKDFSARDNTISAHLHDTPIEIVRTDYKKHRKAAGIARWLEAES